MTRFLIHRPIGVLSIVVALFLLGIVCGLRLPISLLPETPIPEIRIYASYPHASARMMQELLVQNLCNQFKMLGKLDDLQSEARAGHASIKLRFEHQTDINYAMVEVNEKIDAIMGELPRDIPRPRVVKSSISEIPAYEINILPNPSYYQKYPDLQALSSLTNKLIRKQIEQLNEVAMVDLSGLLESEIAIKPIAEKIKPLGILPEDIAKALKNQQQIYGNMTVNDGHYQYNLNLGKEMTHIQEVKEIYLKLKSGKLIQLKDLAEIEYRPIQASGAYLHNGQEAIAMSIIKHPKYQMAALSASLEKTLAFLATEYPEVRFEMSRDQTLLLKYALQNLFQSLALGLMLALLITFVFIRSIRDSILMTIIIPLSLVISLFFFYLMNISINIISLSGLILGVGMMIDNSIIVIDNIAQELKRQGYKSEYDYYQLHDLDQACIRGNGEVIKPLLSSVLTTCSVFIPLVFLSDIVGALFLDQALSVSIALLISYLVSILVLPVLYRLFYAKKIPTLATNFSVKNPLMEFLERHYEALMQLAFRHKLISLSLFFMLAPLSWLLFSTITKSTFPDLKSRDMVLSIDWNEPLSLNENKRRSQELYHQVATELAVCDLFLGKQGFILQDDQQQAIQEVKIYMVLNPQEEGLSEIKNRLNDQLSHNYPQAKWQFRPAKNVFEQVFQEEEGELQLNISALASNGNIYPQDMDELMRQLRQKEIVEEGQSSFLSESIQLNIRLDQLILYEVDYATFIKKLKSLFGKHNIGELKKANSFIDIVLAGNKKDLFIMLNTSYIFNKHGQEIPVRALLNQEFAADFKQINGNQKGEYVGIPLATQDVQKTIQQARIIGDKLTDYQFDYQGNWFRRNKLIKELALVLLMSLVLLYFILAAQFESFIQPIIILLEVAFDISGSLGLLWLFGGSLNLMSGIGIIVVSGIIINDSILKIDTINKLRREESYPILAAIFEGGKRKLRPILMTSLTTILALIPLLFSGGIGADLQKPLAYTIIGGMFIGTIVSLFFIPLAYYSIYHREDFKPES